MMVRAVSCTYCRVRDNNKGLLWQQVGYVPVLDLSENLTDSSFPLLNIKIKGKKF